MVYENIRCSSARICSGEISAVSACECEWKHSATVREHTEHTGHIVLVCSEDRLICYDRTSFAGTSFCGIIATRSSLRV